MLHNPFILTVFQFSGENVTLERPENTASLEPFLINIFGLKVFFGLGGISTPKVYEYSISFLSNGWSGLITSNSLNQLPKVFEDGSNN